MMKKVFLFITTLALFLAAFSCGKENAIGEGIENGASDPTGVSGGPSADEPVTPGSFRAVADPEPDAVAADADFPEEDFDEGSKAYPSWTDSKAQVFWKNGDLVRVYYDRNASSGGVYKVTSGGGTSVATLGWQSGDKDSQAGTGSYFAAYPSSAVQGFSATTFTLTLPAVQQNTSASMIGADQAAQLMLAKCGPERILNFKQVVSLLRFGFQTDFPDGFYCSSVKVTSASSDLAGNLSVSFTGSKPVCTGVVSDGSRSVTMNITTKTFKKGAYTYAFVAPGTYEAGDLTFEFTITNGTVSYKMSKTSPVAVSFQRGKYYQFRFALPAFTDLSASEKANCYVVDASGYYCFDASTRGNGVVTTGATAAGLTGTITGGASAAVYHSDGTDFIDGDFTSGGFLYANGKIYFKTSESLSSAGNKLVSLKNASGTTLWSWHIWCNTNLEDRDIKDVVGDKSTYTFMNMNLGAHRENTFNNEGGNGYYYQWGRKDPMDQRYNDNGSLASPFVFDNTTAPSLSNSIQNPATMYAKQDSPVSTGTFYDWWCAGMTESSAAASSGNEMALVTTSTDACAFSKTMFDPCPPGYHVPTMRQMMAFRGQGLSASSGIVTLTDGESHTHYFPLGNLRNTAGGAINSSDYGVNNSYYYTCYPSQGTGRCVRVWMTGTNPNFGMNTNNRQWFACIIRCAKN